MKIKNTLLFLTLEKYRFTGILNATLQLTVVVLAARIKIIFYVAKNKSIII